MRDPHTIRQVLTDLEGELETKQAEVETLQAGIAALRLMLKGSPSAPAALDQLVQPARQNAREREMVDRQDANVEPSDGPRGRDAVLAVLEESPGEWVAIKDLTETLVQRGWVESARPREAVRTSADRLAKDEDSPVEKGRGKYRLRSNSSEQSDTDNILRPLDVPDQEGDRVPPPLTRSG